MKQEASAGEPSALSRESLALHRQQTDVAGLCADFVKKTALSIGDRKFVRVEGWSSIAVAHGFVPSIKSVVMGPEGTVAVAELRKISDGSFLTSAEGFVGADEPVWYGGPDTIWNKRQQREEEVVRKKRPDYAIRAMAQTRAISRVCRSAFSHVVLLIDEGLSTVPAEEINGGDDELDVTTRREPDAEKKPTPAPTPAPTSDKKNPEVPRDVDPKLKEQFAGRKWEKVQVHFGKNKDKALGELGDNTLKWYIDEWQPKPYNGRISDDDKLLRAALDVAAEEAFK